MTQHKKIRKTFALWFLALIVAFASAAPAFGASAPADPSADCREAQMITPSGPVACHKGFTANSSAAESDGGIAVRTAVEDPLCTGWHTIGGRTYYIDEYGAVPGRSAGSGTSSTFAACSRRGPAG